MHKIAWDFLYHHVIQSMHSLLALKIALSLNFEVSTCKGITGFGKIDLDIEGLGLYSVNSVDFWNLLPNFSTMDNVRETTRCEHSIFVGRLMSSDL